LGGYRSVGGTVYGIEKIFNSGRVSGKVSERVSGRVCGKVGGKVF